VAYSTSRLIQQSSINQKSSPQRARMSATCARFFFRPSSPSAGPWCSGILPPMKPCSLAKSGRAVVM
jgi:hypothetical protein